MTRITVRNIDATTHAFLVDQARNLSSEGNSISVNQLIGTILNNESKRALLNQEMNEIEKLNQRFDYLIDAVTQLTLTYQELIDNQK